MNGTRSRMSDLRVRRVFAALIFGWMAGASAVLAQSAPAEDDSRAAAALTSQYLSTIDPQLPGPALAYWAPEIRAHVTSKALVARWQVAVQDQVDLRRVQPLAVTWYPSEPGSLAAVDVSSLEDAAGFACGFLVWRKAGKDLKLVRQELGHLSPDLLAGLDPAGLQALTVDLRCRRYVAPSRVRE